LKIRLTFDGVIINIVEGFRVAVGRGEVILEIIILHLEIIFQVIGIAKRIGVIIIVAVRI